MSINKDVHTELTKAEVDKLSEVEASLLKTDKADQVEHFRNLKTAFYNLHSESVPLPTSLDELDKLIDESANYLELAECLPALRESDEVDSYVLLGKTLIHYYLKLSQHARNLESRESDGSKFQSGYTFMIKSKPLFRVETDSGNLVRRCEGLIIGAAQRIAEYSMPTLKQLSTYPLDSEYFELGHSAIQVSMNTYEAQIMKIPQSHWLEALYLLGARDYESAAQAFERCRSQETEPYQMRNLTAWANLARLLNSDDEQTRKRYANSVARVTRNPHPDAKKDAEMIEKAKEVLLGENPS